MYVCSFLEYVRLCLIDVDVGVVCEGGVRV